MSEATSIPHRGRPRVSAAVLRADPRELLMVQHRRRDGSHYWQLPGGGLLPGEVPESGLLRQLQEETGLLGEVVGWLFSIPYKYGSSTTYLVEIADEAEAKLGSDPEEAEDEFPKRVDVAWWSLDEMAGNPEVAILAVLLAYI